MDSPSIIDDLPQHLIKEVAGGNCVAFVGAGFGAPAGLPKWGELLHLCLNAAIDRGYLRIGSEDAAATPLIDQGTVPEQEQLAMTLSRGIEDSVETDTCKRSRADWDASYDDLLVNRIRELIDKGNSESFDRAAQTLADALGTTVLDELISKHLDLSTIKEIPPCMMRRLQLLQQIPFRAIVTTNYDSLLLGPTPFSPERPFREVLRPSSDAHAHNLLALDNRLDEVMNPSMTHLAGGECNQYNEDASGSEGTKPSLAKGALLQAKLRQKLGLPEFNVPIVQLHGSVAETSTIVCTRSGYRKLLYSAPGYQMFVQSLMATSTVVYMGFSFTDSYLNETRSAVLSMLDWAGQAPGAGRKQSPMHARTSRCPPIAYAIVNDQSELDKQFLRMHEGVHVLTWSTMGGKLWTGLDMYLESLYAQTCVHMRVGRMLMNKRIVIVDPTEKAFFIGRYAVTCVKRVTDSARTNEANNAEAEAVAASSDTSSSSDESETTSSNTESARVGKSNYVISANDTKIGGSCTPTCTTSQPQHHQHPVPVALNMVRHQDEALHLLEMRGVKSLDVIICSSLEMSELTSFLDRLHRLPSELRAPTVVFEPSAVTSVAGRQLEVLRAGAVAYCRSVGMLMSALQQILQIE